MRYLKQFAFLFALALAYAIPAAVGFHVPRLIQVAGFMASIAMFVAALMIGVYLLKPERKITYALLTIASGAAAAGVGWTIAARDERLVPTLVGGGVIGLAMFLADSWAIPPRETVGRD